MKIVKEAIIDDYHFILGDDYFTVTKDGGELVMLKREELSDLVAWISSEIKPRVLPEIMRISQDVPGHNKQWIGPIKKAEPKTGDIVYDPGARTATQTVELKLGDPSLAYSAGTMLPDGRQGIQGEQVVDLGKLKSKGPLGHS